MVDEHINYDKNDQQNKLLQQLIQQQSVFQEEIIRLKDAVNKPNDNNELLQYKEVNAKLQERIIELQNQFQNQKEDPKITQLNKVKEETVEQINKLKNVQEDIANKLNNNKELESQIKKIVLENTEKFENSEEIIYINSNETKLNYSLKNVTSIEIKDLDLPFDKYQINNNNNKLHLFINNIPDTQINNDSENESFTDIIINQNNIELSIVMGNYNIEKLCEIITNSLSNYNIKMTVSKTTNIITFKSNTNFNLIFNSDSILYNLGFLQNNQSKYQNKNKYVGSKPYDFKIDKCMNIYLTNISETKPFIQYIQNQSLSQYKKMIFTPVISELNSISLKFTDSKNKEFKFDPDNGLDFNLQLSIKYISVIKNEIIVDNQFEINSDDIFNVIKENISIQQ